MDEFNELDEGWFPRKWLDKKQYVRIDPDSGSPQLVRIEPIFSDNGDLNMENVFMTIDNEPSQIIDRGRAEAFIESSGCSPLEITAQWKHKKIN